MTTIPRLVGMVHLLPLPGSPRFGRSMDQVLATAVSDATTLHQAGFPALVVENYGDAPFHGGRVPAETVSAMTAAINAVSETTDTVLGINVLRNDALSALGVAAATGASFIRVNVLTGTMYTDQGLITGAAAEVARTRSFLCPEVEVWGDVLVKHAIPPPGADPGLIAADMVTRGLADAVIVSGSATGAATDLERLRVVAEAVPTGTRVVIGSGATPDSLPSLMKHADTVIVGSWVKVGGSARNDVDPDRARAVVEAARSLGLL